MVTRHFATAERWRSNARSNGHRRPKPRTLADLKQWRREQGLDSGPTAAVPPMPAPKVSSLVYVPPRGFLAYAVLYNVIGRR